MLVSLVLLSLMARGNRPGQCVIGLSTWYDTASGCVVRGIVGITSHGAICWYTGHVLFAECDSPEISGIGRDEAVAVPPLRNQPTSLLSDLRKVSKYSSFTQMLGKLGKIELRWEPDLLHMHLLDRVVRFLRLIRAQIQ